MKKLNRECFFLFGLFLACLPFFYLFFFTNPVADDFVLSHRFQQTGFLELLKNTYLGWNGRYASTFFVYLSPLGFESFLGYKFSLLSIFLIMLLGNYFFIKQLLVHTKTNLHLSLSLLLSLLFLNEMPIISEGIYWYTGAATYTLGSATAFVYLGFLVRSLRLKNNFIKGGVLTGLLFLSCGFNEVLTFLVVFLLGLAVFVSFKNGFEKKKLITVQFLFSLLFMALLVFAPGNEGRGAMYEDSHRFWNSMLFSIAQVGRFSAKWMTSVPLLIASILYIDLNKRLMKEYAFFRNIFSINKWFSLSVLFSLIFICVFPPYWATGILGQHRTLNVAYAFFLPLWFLNLSVWYSYYEDRIKLLRFPFRRSLLVFFLLLSILSMGNGFHALAAFFSGEAVLYDQQMNSRVKMLRDKSNTSDVIVDPLIRPLCLFVSDVTNNPNDWRSLAYNLYFRNDSVSIYLKSQKQNSTKVLPSKPAL